MTGKYRRRDTASVVLAALEDMPVVAVTGMRQTGKSTFLQREPGLLKRRYVTFDDLNLLAAARRAGIIAAFINSNFSFN